MKDQGERNTGLKTYFVSLSNFNRFIEHLLSGSKIVAPIRHSTSNLLSEITSGKIGEICLSGYRTVESFKSYLFCLTEKVSKYFGKDEPVYGESLVFLGMRSCDLEALEVLDRVLIEGEFKDPFYAARREKSTLIGADCTDCGDTCFCNLVGIKPYPREKFDLNLSLLEEGYVVEVGSEKGQILIEKNKSLFQEVPKIFLERREKKREQVSKLVEEKNLNYHLKGKLHDLHRMNLLNKIWRVLTKDCVECSACNFICPTCTCFLLLDQIRDRENERYKVWDACLKTGYARVAGGANSRPKLYERLQNRYHCKFDYSYQRLGRYTCVGCGRCIDGCAANIDMRKIFLELEKQAPLMAKLE
ncbi:MAG: 4Fe-4S dicluster domain-containing protein [Candidatus Margulisiibacteriota bacterium]